MSEEIIKFSFNWNNKLDCNAFTTIRLFDDQKYKLGNTYDIQLNGKSMGNAKIMDIKRLQFHEINNYISYMDTGFSPDEAREIISKIYIHTDLRTHYFMFILLLKVN